MQAAEYDEERYQRLAALPLAKLSREEAWWLARALEYRTHRTSAAKSLTDPATQPPS